MLHGLKFVALPLACILAFSSAGSTVAQPCFPVSSEVVSLGERNARAYAMRSLDREIAMRKASLTATGQQVGKVARDDLNCAPFPNLIGADEWRCKGRARVCAAN